MIEGIFSAGASERSWKETEKRSGKFKTEINVIKIPNFVDLIPIATAKWKKKFLILKIFSRTHYKNLHLFIIFCLCLLLEKNTLEVFLGKIRSFSRNFEIFYCFSFFGIVHFNFQK